MCDHTYCTILERFMVETLARLTRKISTLYLLYFIVFTHLIASFSICYCYNTTKNTLHKLYHGSSLIAVFIKPLTS